VLSTAASSTTRFAASSIAVPGWTSFLGITTSSTMNSTDFSSATDREIQPCASRQSRTSQSFTDRTVSNRCSAFASVINCRQWQLAARPISSSKKSHLGLCYLESASSDQGTKTDKIFTPALILSSLQIVFHVQLIGLGALLTAKEVKWRRFHLVCTCLSIALYFYI
jgi:hypothetical protein